MAKKSPLKLDLDINLLASVICRCGQEIKCIQIAHHPKISIYPSFYFLIPASFKID